MKTRLAWPAWNVVTYRYFTNTRVAHISDIASNDESTISRLRMYTSHGEKSVSSWNATTHAAPNSVAKPTRCKSTNDE